MSNVINRLPVNAAVASLLDLIGRPIGRSRVPTQVGNDQVVADLPYAILYPIRGGDTWGAPLTTPEDSAGLRYQVTSVGLREDSAQWMADEVRQKLIGCSDGGVFESSLIVPGLNVIMREHEGPPSGPVQEGKIWQVVEDYKVTVSLR